MPLYPEGEVSSAGFERGPQGVEGQQGAPGADAPIPLDGEQGPPGSIGPAGERGPLAPVVDGRDGIDGEQGPPGSIGPAGERGPLAPVVDGRDGIDGEQGPPGPMGPMGPRGLQGVPGVDGRDGKDGEQGPPGPNGVSNAVFAGGTFFGNLRTVPQAGSEQLVSEVTGKGLTFSAVLGGPFPRVISQSVQNTADWHTHNVSLSPLRRAGDRMVIAFTTRGGYLETPPAGWTIIHSDGTYLTAVVVIERICDGTEPDVFQLVQAWSATDSSAVVWIIRDSDNATPLVVQTTEGTDKASVNPANFAPGFASADVRTLWISAMTSALADGNGGAGASNVDSYPSGTSNQAFVRSNLLVTAAATRELQASSWDPSAYAISGYTAPLAGAETKATTFAVPPLSVGKVSLNPAIITFLQGLGYSGPT